MLKMAADRLSLVVSCAVVIGAVADCGQTTTTTSTTTTPDSESTYTEKRSTTVIGDQQVHRTEIIDSSRGPSQVTTITGDPDADEIHINTDTLDADTRKSVRAPLVKVDSDNADGSVHVRVPFVKIDKAGYGHKTQVRLPGIRINSDD